MQERDYQKERKYQKKRKKNSIRNKEIKHYLNARQKEENNLEGKKKNKYARKNCRLLNKRQCQK